MALVNGLRPTVGMLKLRAISKVRTNRHYILPYLDRRKFQADHLKGISLHLHRVIHDRVDELSFLTTIECGASGCPIWIQSSPVDRERQATTTHYRRTYTLTELKAAGHGWSGKRLHPDALLRQPAYLADFAFEGSSNADRHVTVFNDLNLQKKAGPATLGTLACPK